MVLGCFVITNNVVVVITIVLNVIKAVLFVHKLTNLLDTTTTSIGHGAARNLCVFALQRLRRGVIRGCVSVNITSVLVVLAVVLVTSKSAHVVSCKGRVAQKSSICSFAIANGRTAIRGCLSNGRVRPCITSLDHVRAKAVGHPTSIGTGSFVS